MKNALLATALILVLAACGSDEAPSGKAPESMPARQAPMAGKMETAAPEAGMGEMGSDMEEAMDDTVDDMDEMTDEAADEAESMGDKAMGMAQDAYEEVKEDEDAQAAMDDLQQQAKDATKAQMDQMMKKP